MINASESKQNKQEESCTVILPQKVFLVLGDQNIDQWLRPVNALLQIWRYGRLEKWGTLFACLLQIATSVNEPLVYLLQMLSLRLYVRIKEKSNYLRWYDEESFRIKTLSRKKEKNWLQCDQIGRFLEVFDDIFFTKVAQIYIDFVGYFWKTSKLSKNCFGSFLGVLW